MSEIIPIAVSREVKKTCDALPGVTSGLVVREAGNRWSVDFVFSLHTYSVTVAEEAFSAKTIKTSLLAMIEASGQVIPEEWQ